VLRQETHPRFRDTDTPAQIESMVKVQNLFRDNAAALPLRKGDMVFLNSMAIIHSREVFREGGDLQQHLLGGGML